MGQERGPRFPVSLSIPSVRARPRPPPPLGCQPRRDCGSRRIPAGGGGAGGRVGGKRRRGFPPPPPRRGVQRSAGGQAARVGGPPRDVPPAASPPPSRCGKSGRGRRGSLWGGRARRRRTRCGRGRCGPRCWCWGRWRAAAAEVSEDPARRGRGSPEIRAAHPAAARAGGLGAGQAAGRPRASALRVRGAGRGPPEPGAEDLPGPAVTGVRGHLGAGAPVRRSPWPSEVPTPGRPGACGGAGTSPGRRASQVVWGLRVRLAAVGTASCGFPGLVPLCPRAAGGTWV